MEECRVRMHCEKSHRFQMKGAQGAGNAGVKQTTSLQRRKRTDRKRQNFDVAENLRNEEKFRNNI